MAVSLAGDNSLISKYKNKRLEADLLKPASAVKKEPKARVVAEKPAPKPRSPEQRSKGVKKETHCSRRTCPEEAETARGT